MCLGSGTPSPSNQVHTAAMSSLYAAATHIVVLDVLVNPRHRVVRPQQCALEVRERRRCRRWRRRWGLGWLVPCSHPGGRPDRLHCQLLDALVSAGVLGCNVQGGGGGRGMCLAMDVFGHRSSCKWLATVARGHQASHTVYAGG